MSGLVYRCVTAAGDSAACLASRGILREQNRLVSMNIQVLGLLKQAKATRAAASYLVPVPLTVTGRDGSWVVSTG